MVIPFNYAILKVPSLTHRYTVHGTSTKQQILSFGAHWNGKSFSINFHVNMVICFSFTGSSALRARFPVPTVLDITFESFEIFHTRRSTLVGYILVFWRADLNGIFAAHDWPPAVATTLLQELLFCSRNQRVLVGVSQDRVELQDSSSLYLKISEGRNILYGKSKKFQLHFPILFV